MNRAPQQQPEQQPEAPQEQREQRKAPGRPFEAGDPRINRAGRPKKETEVEAVGEPAEPPGDFDLLGEMEALLRQPASQDRGETQKGLRKWYDADVKGFMGQLAGLKREQMRAASKSGDGGPCPACAARKAEEEEANSDEGTARALAACEALMSQWGVTARVGSEVGHRWDKLTVQQRRLILETAGVACTPEFLGSDTAPGTEGRRHVEVR
jgi:hypothetical protein